MIELTTSKPRFDYIDCVRGYAVLLVITAHYAEHVFPNLPFPVHRLAVMGWYGVQLFFIASSVTLLMSWRYEEKARGRADLRAFFIRRLFRIAPAYYAAATFYFIVTSPVGGFDFVQALAATTFVNGWHPVLMPTVAGQWYVIPGGWSIAVEFTFYVLFPLYAAWVRSLTKALIALAGAILVGLFINRWEFLFLSATYSPATVQNFLFFWFPNQACVFAFGGVAFCLMGRMRGKASGTNFATLCAMAAVSLFFSLSFLPLGQFLGDRPIVPVSLAVSLPLALFMVALSHTKNKLLVNVYVMHMGKVSFSAYLVHFAVLRALSHLPGLNLADISGYPAIVLFVAFWPVVILLSYFAAWCSYRFIEVPGIAVGKGLVARLQGPRPAIEFASPHGS